MEDKVENLVKWLSQSDKFYVSDSIGIIDTPEAGRGGFLTHGKITKNDNLISIPGYFQINYHTVLYHISRFLQDIDLPNFTSDDDCNEAENMLFGEIDIDDPRSKAYSIFSEQYLLSLSSFQLLAIFIVAEKVLLPIWSKNKNRSFWKPFFDVWPTKEELSSIPAIWSCDNQSQFKDLVDMLPTESSKHCIRISELIKNDWKVIKPIFQKWECMFDLHMDIEALHSEFLHIYFIINSRCLFFEIPLKEGDIFSQFTLVPFVDFLNHSDQVDVYCYPKFEKRTRPGYFLGKFNIICGVHNYVQPGEQILLNYGAHSNDFLLNEYGFTLDQNKWNYINIDKEIMTIIDQDKKIRTYLEEKGYLGDYTINGEEISYRTLVAMSLIVTKDFKRVEKLINGYISEDFFLPKIKPVLINIFKKVIDDSEKKINLLKVHPAMKANELCVRNLINIHDGNIKILRKYINGDEW